MARKFNLQPWRAQLREKQKKQFVATTIVLGILTAGLCYGYYLYKQNYREDQLAAIATLDKNIAELKKAELEVNKARALQEEVAKQITVIQNLQNQRSLTVEILDYLATRMPDSVFINSIDFSNDIKKGNGILTITGVAENETGASSLMSNLQAFPRFSDIDLDTMKKAESNQRYSVPEDTSVRTFVLNIKVSPQITDDINNKE